MQKPPKKMTELEMIENEIAKHNAKMAKKAEDELYKGMLIEFFASSISSLGHVVAFVAGAVIGLRKGK
jgi:hypothetical protein